MEKLGDALSLGAFLTPGIIVGAVSVFVAIATFLIRSFQMQRQERRQMTFQLISRIFEPGPIADARVKMARWIAQDVHITDDFMDDEEKDAVILSIIDFYEFTCEGAMRGVVDARLLNQESGGRMERAFFVVRGYIKAREERLGSINEKNGLPKVKLYRHLRGFLSKYRGLRTELG